MRLVLVIIPKCQDILLCPGERPHGSERHQPAFMGPCESHS